MCGPSSLLDHMAISDEVAHLGGAAAVGPVSRVAQKGQKVFLPFSESG